MWEFTTTDELINMILANRNKENHAWIFDDGQLNPDVYTCDVLQCIKDISNLEVEKDSEEFDHVMMCTHDFEEVEMHNNYNYNGNSSEVIEYHIYKAWEYCYVGISIHIGMDVRCGYTPMVLYKFDVYEDFIDAFQTDYSIETKSWIAYISCSAFSELNSIHVITNDGADLDMLSWESDRSEIMQAIFDMIEEEESND